MCNQSYSCQAAKVESRL